MVAGPACYAQLIAIQKDTAYIGARLQPGQLYRLGFVGKTANLRFETIRGFTSLDRLDAFPNLTESFAELQSRFKEHLSLVQQPKEGHFATKVPKVLDDLRLTGGTAKYHGWPIAPTFMSDN